MLDFEFHNPTKIIFGKTAMDKIAENVEFYGKKVLVTYGGGSIKKNGIYNKVMQQLKNFEVKEFGGIEPNPRVETIRRAIKEFKSFNPDLVLAVGGGSTIDGSKLLISAMHYDGDPWDFIKSTEVKPEKYIPLGVVLTMSATGSEMNPNSVITNWETHEKIYFERKNTYPAFSILDPQNLYSLPADQTAYGVIDAFSHVLEQYMTTTENAPLQDRFSEGLLMTLIENGKKAIDNPKDYTSRANIMLSACMALNGIIRSGVYEDWATHRIEHEISAFYDIPHAAGLAIITPRWMKVVKKQKQIKIAQYGRRIWELTGENDSEIADQAIQKTFDFFKSLGVKMTFKEWNIIDEHFQTMVDRLVKAGIGEKALSAEQIETILKTCLK